ncbi:MAG: hypothetical protein PWQ77_456 [Kosmotogales bacterium]|nr:hypothetical protein [Kosmotogales bacterium]
MKEESKRFITQTDKDLYLVETCFRDKKDDK